jgi:predicted nucleic acid-binding Zn ribbon protein
MDLTAKARRQGDPAARASAGQSKIVAAETEVIDTWSKIVGGFIAAHSTPVALRERILYVRVLQPALHYELEQIAKSEILRKLKQRFGDKTIRDVRFHAGLIWESTPRNTSEFSENSAPRLRGKREAFDCR